MAAWSKRVVVFERREWILALPAHPAEVASTLAAADAEYETCAGATEFTVRSEDSEKLIVSFTMPCPSAKVIRTDNPDKLLPRPCH